MQSQKIAAWPLCLFFLFGLFFVGNGAVLCIGDDGHIEFETHCVPGCGETKEAPEIDLSDALQVEHIDCSNCTDIDLNNPLWSRRGQTYLSGYTADFSLMSMPNADLRLTCTQADIRMVNPEQLAFGHNPSSCSIISTILLC